MFSAPVRGNSNDGTDAWVCRFCTEVICVDCYHDHTVKKHPNVVAHRKKTKK